MRCKVCGTENKEGMLFCTECGAPLDGKKIPENEKAEVAFNEALSIDKKSSDAALGLAKVCNEKEDGL